jgi:prepilin peptidase CpaA
MLEPLTNQAMTFALLVVLMIALATDLHDRRIPNVLIAIGLVAGLAGQAWLTGVAGLAAATVGAITGLLCLLPFYMSGGMGAGDVKLMAVCGAFLGPLHVILAAAATLAIGGVIGVFWLVWQTTVPGGQRGGHDARVPVLPASDPGEAAGCPPLPYAVAIAAGVVAELQLAPALASIWAGGLL